MKLTTTLAAGEYEITCGLITNPHGELTVSPNLNTVQIQAIMALTKKT